jgi:hypothetical protein
MIKLNIDFNGNLLPSGDKYSIKFPNRIENTEITAFCEYN